MNQSLTLSIVAFIGLAIFMNIQKNIIENFAGMPFPMTWKINREVAVPRCNNKPKMFSVSGNYQSSLTPRFSNVGGYGTRIRYRKPCQEVLGVPEHPLTYYKGAVDSCNPLVESFDGGVCSGRRDAKGCNLPPLCDLSRIDVNDKCGGKKCPQSATVSSMLPVTDMRTINAMTSVQSRENQHRIEGALKECGAPSSVCEDNQQPIVYDRLIYANARSRLRGAGDYLRGDLPIIPCLPESNPDSLIMFRPSVTPSIDLQQGALSVMGGFDNTTQRQLNSLIQRSSDGTVGTFSGIPINNQQLSCTSASDVVVSNFL
jgi:hypothetical protein